MVYFGPSFITKPGLDVYCRYCRGGCKAGRGGCGRRRQSAASVEPLPRHWTYSNHSPSAQLHSGLARGCLLDGWQR